MRYILTGDHWSTEEAYRMGEVQKAASAGGFPAMTEHVAFLMKHLVLFAASFPLLKEDLVRASVPSALSEVERIWWRDEAQSINSISAQYGHN
jgi:hypothetical protein